MNPLFMKIYFLIIIILTLIVSVVNYKLDGVNTSLIITLTILVFNVVAFILVLMDDSK